MGSNESAALSYSKQNYLQKKLLTLGNLLVGAWIIKGW